MLLECKSFLIKMQILVKISSRWQISDKKRFWQCSRSFYVRHPIRCPQPSYLFIFSHTYSIIFSFCCVKFCLLMKLKVACFTGYQDRRLSLPLHTHTQFPVKESISLIEYKSLRFHILPDKEKNKRVFYSDTEASKSIIHVASYERY